VSVLKLKSNEQWYQDGGPKKGKSV